MRYMIIFLTILCAINVSAGSIAEIKEKMIVCEDTYIFDTGVAWANDTSYIVGVLIGCGIAGTRSIFIADTSAIGFATSYTQDVKARYMLSTTNSASHIVRYIPFNPPLLYTKGFSVRPVNGGTNESLIWVFRIKK